METSQTRILLVEDNRGDAVLLQDMLLGAVPGGGFDLTWDDRLGKALARLQRETFDAILLDLTLPDSRGLATLERIREGAPGAPTIVLTGVEDEEVAIRAIRQGAQDYLVKGTVDGRGVAKAIRFAIDRKKTEDALRRSEAAYAAAKASLDTVHAMTAGVLLADMGGWIVSVNPAFERVTGYRNEDLAGNGTDAAIRRMVCPEDLSRALEALKAAQQGQPTGSFSMTIMTKYGAHVPLTAGLSHIRDAAGLAATMVLTVSDVSDLKRVEEELRKSQATLREAQHIAHIGNWDWDLATRAVEWSDEVYRIFGLTPQTFGATHDAFIERVHPYDRKRVSHLVNQALEGKQPYYIDHRVVRPDGSERMVHQQAEVFRDDAGRPVRALGIVQDITERREAEKRDKLISSFLTLFARKSAKKDYLYSVVRLLRHASRCRCVGVRVVDVDGHIPYEASVGFSQKFRDQESRLSLREDVCACIRVGTGSPEPQDLPMMTPAGSFCCNDSAGFVGSLTEAEKARFRGECVKHGFLSIGVIPARHHERVMGAIHLADERPGMLTRETVAFIEKVAPLVGEALFRFRMEETLRESESRYRTLVENLPAVTYTAAIDAAGTTTFMSPQVEPILGFSPEEFYRDPALWDRQLHPDDRARVLAELRAACARVVPFVSEYRIHTRDGREVWIRDQAAPIRDEFNTPRFIQGVMYDITEEKKAALALRVYQDELRALSFRLSMAEERARRDLAVALHDTVGQTLALSKIKLGALGQLITDPEASRGLAEIRGMFEDAVRQTRTLSFELSPPILYELGLDAALEWLGEEFQKRHGFQFQFDSETEKHIPESVGVLVFQAVRELLVNIGKHAKARHVKVASRMEGTRLHVSVQDDGDGFDLEAAMATAAGKASLGLFSIRERMRHIGGSFTMESKPGRGTMAVLSAPLGSEQAQTGGGR